MRTLPQNGQCESTAGRGWGAAGPRLSSGCVPSWGWENTTDPTGRRSGGVPSDSRQLTRPTGEQEATCNRRPGDQITDCCRSGPVRVPSLWLYFIRRSSPLQRLPSPRGHTAHPPNRCVQKSKGKDHTTGICSHSLWHRGWSDLSINGCWYTTCTLTREEWQLLLFRLVSVF